ncbi:type II toxin-antitoxin system Phd/YefM family antitoxin [Desulfonatronum sp. SC1]|uniref:type II toxin-antitoxin system Phd/YefM family antitoxin n=1 Tax=Desulfonatronum sp. SC1 TaxID=2109626 RepID=UPI000D31EDCD|nr:type II toxin-antitoxin system prevent-host-death family antitoxin [Desulfonatronum sp. SC1]PTN31537.1 prevent-host-death protein [Desulfonatronum sp. SC1]
MLQTTYTNARANFSTLCDTVVEDREIVVITRRTGQDVALVAADELSSLMETAHLLRSPKNARRLLTALNRALDGEGEAGTLQKLKTEAGLAE